MRPDGEQRRVLSMGTSVKDDGGSVALAIVVFRDVTELRRLEQQRDEYLGARLARSAQSAGQHLVSHHHAQAVSRDGEAALLEHDPAIPSFLERSSGTSNE